MENRRLELSKILRGLIESDNVYFQPPPSVEMKYPAIVYEREKIESTNADNTKYLKHVRYMLKYISRNPDDEMVFKLSDLPYCSHQRRYVADGLYHDVFELYY